jgi:hypothetical protein
MTPVIANTTRHRPHSTIATFDRQLPNLFEAGLDTYSWRLYNDRVSGGMAYDGFSTHGQGRIEALLRRQQFCRQQ